jgi:hypothetical protein
MNRIIISDTDIIQTAIAENLPSAQVKLIKPDRIQSLNHQKIFELLIFDSSLPPPEALSNMLYKVKSIINLSKYQLSYDSITLRKPLYLAKLLDIINKALDDTNIFHTIGEMIFNEQMKSISSKEIKHKLTDKEVSLLKAILTSPHHQISRLELLNNIWGYHPESDSSTIETHIYRLKQKLPEGTLHIKDSVYSLTI